MEDTNDRIKSFDLLRSLATIYIVAIWHLYIRTSIDNFTNNFTFLITYCTLGTFVYMSGYVLSMKYRHFTDIDGVISFLTRRFMRIYPLYLIAVVGFLACRLIEFRAFSYHILLIDMLTKESGGTLWFVSMMFLFYLAFILLTYRFSASRIIIMAIFIYIFFVVTGALYRFSDPRLIIYFPMFIFGVLSHKYDLHLYFREIFILVLSLLICICFVVLYVYSSGYIQHLLQIPSMVSCMPVVIRLSEKLSEFVPRMYYRHIAYASFCMYLIHDIIFTLLLKLYHPDCDMGTILYLSLIGVPSIYLISLYMQATYDRISSCVSLNLAKSEPKRS